MASDATLHDPDLRAASGGAALQHCPRRSQGLLSSGLARALRFGERFLADAGFDRGPWLAVSFGAGIALAVATLRRNDEYAYIRQALGIVPLAIALGCVTVWSKSAAVGSPAIERAGMFTLTATVLSREDQPANDRSRLVLAIRDPDSERALRIRINVPNQFDRAGVEKGALIRVRARLMPPAAPMLPGAYDFARTAWFAGLSATGSAMAPVDVRRPATAGGLLGSAQAHLAAHIRQQLPGSSGSIAATLASGDRGGIAEEDIVAMRDSGLAHLLSISGLHVSAVIAAAYFLAIKLLALWPWLALRVRLPVVAAGFGALTGIAYTLLTGGEVPTVRSCIGALLVLAALALGREPLSLRMLAVAAAIVLLFWPEAIVGPSFQMSFAAVTALIAVGGSPAARRFLAPRDESWLVRQCRYLTMLFVTGVVIEIALMPIGLYHFHRAGVYGALANVIAIPLTTALIMPLIAGALVLDLFGAGQPLWWLAGKAIDLMLAMAHWFADRPGAVTQMPAMGTGSFILFIAGGVWLALWQNKARWLGLIPAAFGAFNLALLEPPDILVSGDGRHVAIPGESRDALFTLGSGTGDYAYDNLSQLAATNVAPRTIEEIPAARCNRDFCSIALWRGGRKWRVLIARSRDRVPVRSLAAACDRADIVIAVRWLPGSCRPAWLKADRAFLSRTGGLAIDLDRAAVATVAEGQGEHGWWRGERIARAARSKPAATAATPPR